MEIRSVRQANLLHGKLYHIHDGHREHAMLGSSNFTRRGLGLAATPNIELNLIVDSDRDRADLKEWFDDIWADEKLVEAAPFGLYAIVPPHAEHQTIKPSAIYCASSNTSRPAATRL